MPTATKKKKPSKKKATSRTTTTAARVTTAGAGDTELFSTRSAEEQTINVPQNAVALYVKGQNKGNVDTTGRSLADFVKEHAQRAGIVSFAVYADGVKVTPPDGGRKMAEFRKIEIVPKDSRGYDDVTFFTVADWMAAR